MKMYTYYVASFNRWTTVEADGATEAIEEAGKTELLSGLKILTVRIVNRRNGEFLSDLEEVNEVAQ